VLSSSGVGLVDQDVTSTVTPIDVPFGTLMIPQVVVTPNEEPLCTSTFQSAEENSGGSSRQTFPVEIEESSIQRTGKIPLSITQSQITQSAAKVKIAFNIIIYANII
jgi:hypothetical protein